MKNFTIIIKSLFLALGFLGCYSIPVNSQIINRNINFEVRPYEIYYNGFNDVSSPGEVNVNINFRDPAGTWYNDICFDFSAPSVPFTYTNTDPNNYYYWGTDWAWNSEWDVFFEGWEDDNGEVCNYNSTGSNPDDDFYSAYCVYTNSGATSTSISQNAARWSSLWYSNDNDNTGGWLLPNSSIWDIKMRTAWRYSSGDNCSDPLEFGTLNEGQQYVTFNATSTAIESEHSGNAPLTYTNTQGNASADIYYRFTINEEMSINVNTLSASTNYDTHLRIYESGCGNELAANDDVVQGNVQSEIITILGPGTYIIEVEGYSTSEGLLQLNVKGTATITSLNVTSFNEEEIKIYPNPASDNLFIDIENLASDKVDVSLVNIVGAQIYSATFSTNNIQIPLSGFESGTYFVLINSGNESIRRKISIE